jgi:hypothetical protein
MSPEVERAACDVEDGVPVALYAWHGTAADPLSDLPIEAFPLAVIHRDVAREGVQQGDVLLG